MTDDGGPTLTPPHPVGAGFHARPAWVYGQHGFARMKWCAGCARGIGYVRRRTEAVAPWVTWVQLVTPAIRTHPTPAAIQTRGVEDAAPYGRQLNVGISIVVSSCARVTASATPSAPLKGELSRRFAP